VTGIYTRRLAADLLKGDTIFVDLCACHVKRTRTKWRRNAIKIWCDDGTKLTLSRRATVMAEG
jgi:hypothetical protein